ncbi:MAG: hypothetical protein WD845_06810 [Pirellulales bacterium]
MMTFETATLKPDRGRRRKLIAVSVMACLAGLLGITAYKFSAIGTKSSRVTPSRDTTFITSPLRADGSVDYIAAINQRFGEGVTPETNASVLIWHALGPQAYDATTRNAFFKALGIPMPSEQGDYFVSLESFAKSMKVEPSGASGPAPASVPDFEKLVAQFHAASDGPLVPEDVRKLKEVLEGKVKPAALVELEAQLEQAVARPWSQEEFPPLAEWIRTNKAPLDIVLEASRRPRRFDPIIVAPSETYRYFSAPRTMALESRSLADALLARALLRASTDEVDAAWQDLIAAHRLSRLVMQGPTLIDWLSGLEINRQVCVAQRALLQHAELGPDEIAVMRADLDALSPITDVADTIDWSERFERLDSMFALAQEMSEGSAAPGSRFPFHDFSAFRRNSIDWNQVFKEVNVWLDRSVAACRLPTREMREAALEELENDYIKQGKDLRSLSRSIASALGSRHEKSMRMSHLLVALFLPASLSASDSQLRGMMDVELTKAAFAIAAYRADHGKYPQTLAELAPDYMAASPDEDFIGAPLRYVASASGYSLQCAGPNDRLEALSEDGKPLEYPWGDDMLIELSAVALKSGVP